MHNSAKRIQPAPLPFFSLRNSTPDGTTNLLEQGKYCLSISFLSASHRESNKAYFSFLTRRTQCYRWDLVQEWTGNLPRPSLFELDKVFFPIHVNTNHWILVVAHMKEKKIRVYDSLRSPKHGSQLANIMTHIHYYLVVYSNRRLNQELPTDDWLCIDESGAMPKQDNGEKLFF